jgi:hypothetical protein
MLRQPHSTPSVRAHHAPAARVGVISLARKPNYDFEKRRKEQDRKAKKDAKREDRLRRKAEGLPEDGDVVGEPGTEPASPQIPE